LLLEFAVLNRLLQPVEAIVARLRSVQGPMPPPLEPLDTSTTDFRYLDLGLRQMLERIRAGHEQERQFIAQASHELLTPIAVLQSRFENMLAADTPGESLPETAEMQVVASQKTLHRLTATLRTLLMISRIENQQFTHVELLDVGAVFADVFAELEDLIADRGLSVRGLSDVAPGRLMMPYANRELLFTLLYNLLSNAIKYNAPDGWIELSAVFDGATREATLCIRNPGPTLAPQQLAHVFERFYRADANGTVEGHGLGLALALAIARLHGIQLTLGSEAVTGTTARLRWLTQTSGDSPTGLASR
jgi:signal transduction histidine kinase